MSEIKHAYPLILNKVASPHYATPILRRARLLDWLNESSDCRAVVIAADAGYGKTTLLWQWEREVGFPCFWYKLDRNDRDWTFHISYLIESIAKRHKGFGRRAHSMLEQIGGPGSSRPGVAAYLLAEMHQRLTEPCTFIIDDWQYVNAVTEVRGLWNQILRDAPPTCRFVFASRAKPRLQFARFKTHGGYAEIRTDALRFTETEIAALFRDIYNDPLEPSELTELERRTEGWAASLQLVEVSLRERTSPEARREFIGSITAATDSDLFDFLAEEVLDQQPEETRNFLLTTSILQQITPEVAERLAGVHDGRRELMGLEHRGLFTNRLDEDRYRYHNLFREFLERRLITERTESEVLGLHIHAASYFETSHQWPEAIHHYLRAGLQRQAARLIAKHGEDVVSVGGLGLVDKWLQQLPEESIRQNARLSLLLGEAAGVRGDWDIATAALERARDYFARKGDRRQEALACLKLSSVHMNRGDLDSCGTAADAAGSLVPLDATATRLRIRGNIAVTRGWLTEPLEVTTRECRQIASEASALGLDHIAAIAHHNAGASLRHAGRYGEAIAHLERSDEYWSGSPTSPFADNLELVQCLLASNDPERARAVAMQALKRTAPWLRPRCHARHGHALVLANDGRFEAAIAEFSEVIAAGVAPGGILAQSAAGIAECLFLNHAPSAEVQAIARIIDTEPHDFREESETLAATAVGRHTVGRCKGECQALLTKLIPAEKLGSIATSAIVRVKIGALAFEHRQRRPRVQAWIAARDAVALGLAPMLRWWLRRYASPSAVGLGLSIQGLSSVIAQLARVDPEGWRTSLVAVLPGCAGETRRVLLDSLERIANRDVTSRLVEIDGADVADLRRRLLQQQAGRLFVRIFGRLSVHRGNWSGPEIIIDKKRVRALLAVLAAHSQEPLTRDSLADSLWPEADGDSAVNNLNQAVFQLRRYLDPDYRAGDSPEYVISNADGVALSPSLVHVDMREVLRIGKSLSGMSWDQRNGQATRLLDFVRGEFLAEFRYEDWVRQHQHLTEIAVRAVLLPIASAAPDAFQVDVRMRACAALLSIDPYDEGAVLAMAGAMASSGRRIAARDMVIAFARRIREELEDEPSGQVVAALGSLSKDASHSRFD